MKKLKLELKSKKELERKYPKCFSPLGLQIMSVQFPDKRTDINDWFSKFAPHGTI